MKFALTSNNKLVRLPLKKKRLPLFDIYKPIETLTLAPLKLSATVRLGRTCLQATNALAYCHSLTYVWSNICAH